MKAGADFHVGYSPERINPGDKTHRFETITKVVSAQDDATLEIVADVYGSVVTAGIHRAPSIKVAEAAKVIENTQRDLNIAFMNELSLIFQALDIDTGDVLAAAAHQMEFPAVLSRAWSAATASASIRIISPIAPRRPAIIREVILAGRRINDDMGRRIARECIRGLLRRKGQSGTVTVLGMTFKENVPDIRNSRVIDIVQELRDFGIDVQITDPLADSDGGRSKNMASR